MLNHTMLTAKVLKSMSVAVGLVIGEEHPSDVADVVQDALVKVLASLDSFDASQASFATWCSRIARNEARNWRKASANHGHDSVGHCDEEGEPTELVDTLQGSDGRIDAMRAEEGQWLAEALATLTDDERTFIRAINQGMGQTEAGALVGWSPATATRRRKAIAEKLAALR